MNVNDILIQTPMMTQLHQTITRWTQCGFTGGVVIGDARLGKSWAMRALGKELRTTENEPIKVFSVSVGERDVQTIRSVYVRVAHGINDKTFKKGATSDELEDFIFHAFSEAALCNQRRQVVLVVDEAQWLTLDQFSVFAEIFNDQDQIQNRLIVYFIANRQKFQPIAKLLLEPQNDYLRERFFHNIHQFYGIRTFKELCRCLAFLDRFRLPADNSCSIVKYHCPRMLKDGVSLADLAEPIWEVYDEHYAKPLQLQSWGMTYFQRTISILLMDYLSYYWCNDREAIQEMVGKSIVASGIVPSLKSVA